MKKILVVGGAGYIGSYVAKLLNSRQFAVLTVDNLSTGDRRAIQDLDFIEGDIQDRAFLESVFTQHAIDGVMHFAASKDVGESVRDPALYYRNNVSNTLNLLDVMHQFAIHRFLFSSTAAIFGNPEYLPIDEKHPCSPINPYGKSKWMVEELLKDFEMAYGMRSCCLRYFNAAGADPEGKIKIDRFNQPNLIPIILNAIKKGTPVKINGTDYQTNDGTCVRDYIHIHDLAMAHVIAMEKLLEGAPSACYNLGNGEGFSVREVIQSAQEVTRKRISVIEGPRRLGDPAILCADASLAKCKLGWEPIYPSITTMIQHAWLAMS